MQQSEAKDRWNRIWLPALAATAVAVIAAAIGLRHWRPASTTIQGAVIRSDKDSLRELPIADVQVTVKREDTSFNTRSDPSGHFKISIPGVVWPGQVLNLTFEHPDYKTLALDMPVHFRSTTRQLVVAAMVPIAPIDLEESQGPAVVVSNIRVRYTVNSQSDQNIGSAVKVFQVFNRGNVPCRHEEPCSPDGYWKASVGSAELDAGAGNEFRDARATCIAGPCPFTRIDSKGFASGGRTITASALDWSDTATFLLEAEVFHTGIVSNVRETYPVQFGRALHFTLPPTEEGVSFEAELNGSPMVFPLGPDLDLSWATCSARPSSEVQKSMLYQCVLKAGFRF